MKKGLAFVLVFALIFGTFGFAFASDASNGIENSIKINNSDALSVSYGGIECKAVEMSEKDFVVVKQSTFAIIWTKDTLSSAEETALIEELKGWDGSLKNSVDNFYFTTTEWLGGGANEGNYYFEVSSDVYDMEGTLLSGKYAIASPWDKVSHFLVGTFNDTPTYSVNYRINKDVVVSGGAFAEKEFTFDVEVVALSGSAISELVDDPTITISPNETSDYTTVELTGLIESDFPFRLVFSEKTASGSGWVCDGNVYSVDITLEDGQVQYSVPAQVTFTNYFDGFYEINIPFEKDILGDSGFPDTAFEFIATTTPGGVILGSTTQTFTPDGATTGIINVDFPAGTDSEDFPTWILVEEVEGTNPSWEYDGAKYLVTVSLVDGVPTITGSQEITEIVPTANMESVLRPDSIIFTNTYSAPLAIDIPFTKNVVGEQYGSQSFNFTAELIVGDMETVATDTATLHFSNGLQTTSGGFEFELTSTQVAAWLPAQIKIYETTGTSDDWDYDQNVFWASVDEDGNVSDMFDVGQATASSVTFTNSYEGEAVDLEIPIHKLGSVISGSFGSQTFNFDVSVKHGDGWEALSGTSITLTYPEDMTGHVVLSFSENQLEQYGEDYGYPIILRIVEDNGGASNWTYDTIEYFVELSKDGDFEQSGINIMQNSSEWAWQIITPAAINMGCDCPTLEEVAAMLPENGNFILDYGTNSKFIMDISNAGTLNGEHRAWCIDLDHGVYYDPTYFANFYSSFAPIPVHLTGGTVPNIDYPGNLDLVNWVLNNHEGFTPGETQNVIWHLVDSTPEFVLTDNERALYDSAFSNGEGFEPDFCNGDVMGIISEPTMMDGQSVSGQALLLEFELECEPIYQEETEIIFRNSFKRTGGTSDDSDNDRDNDRDTSNIDEIVTPLEEAPVEIQEVAIPEAEIPATGGMGIGLFLMLGGIVTATGVAVRRKENLDE